MSLTYLILPVRNRRVVTLRCLDHLAREGVLAWARAVVVDDGSTDGTAEAIRQAHPTVEILPGDGNLYWTGAIVLGMRHAMARGADCCVWLNDDTHPLPGVIGRVVDYALAHRCVAAGLSHFVGDDVTIPPYRKTSRGLQSVACRPGSGPLLEVDATRGNLTAIPRPVIEAIGYPDAEGLPHYFGDVDYTLRATGAGFRCVVDPANVVEEQEHSGNWDESWLTSDRPLRQIWARFGVKQASVYWRANWVYDQRHWGLLSGAFLFAKPYVRLALISLVRLTLPRAWILRLRPAKSR